MSPKRSRQRLRLSAVGLAALALVMAYALGRAGAQQATPTPAPHAAAAAQPAAPFDAQQKLAEINRQIAGKEALPAEQVFKNVQQLKGVPARRLPLIMNAYTRALGVDCAHCHVVDQWEKDDKPAKQTARDMMRMVSAVNGDHIKNMKGLTAGVAVNCSTCHRGQLHPDSRLPEPKAK